jgi:hypothetical protein
MTKTAAAWFRAADSKRVTATAHGILTVEQWPDYRARVIAHLIDTGQVEASAVFEDDRQGNLLLPGSAQIIRKPKMRRVRSGLLEVRSKDYILHMEDGKTSYGDKKGAKITLDGDLRRDIPEVEGGCLIYSIEEE